MNNPWGMEKIQEILPQKFPFLFIDKVVSLDKEQRKITCIKCVTNDEYFFKGHFPGNPVMPGVIIIEALAQASIILYSTLKPHIVEKKPDYYLGKVEAKFKIPVTVGDKLVLEVFMPKATDNGAVVEALAKVGEDISVIAKIVFGAKLHNAKER